MPAFRVLGTLALFLLLPATALAQQQPCPVPGIPCDADLPGWITGRLAAGIGGAMFLIMSGMFVFYALKLTVSSSEENFVTEARNAYLHALFGAILVAVAWALVPSVPPGSLGINVGPISSVLVTVGEYFLALVGGALIIHIAYEGGRLINAADENAESNAKQGLARSFIGITLVVLATRITDAFALRDSSILGTELAGLGRFLATILGTLAVVAIVVAGIFLIVSVDEGLKDRAKKTIIGAAVTLIIVISSRAILSMFF